MTPSRYRRLVAVLLVLAGVGVATVLGLMAFRKNILYYYTPSQVTAGAAEPGRAFRMGGLVAMGSVQRVSGTSKAAEMQPAPSGVAVPPAPPRFPRWIAGATARTSSPRRARCRPPACRPSAA